MKTKEEIQLDKLCKKEGMKRCKPFIKQEPISDKIAKEIRGKFADMFNIPRGIIEKSTKQLELEQDLDHFKKTEKIRELNSFEQGIKEEIERLLELNKNS